MCVGLGSKHNRRFNYIHVGPFRTWLPRRPQSFSDSRVLSGDRNPSDVVSQNRYFAVCDDISYGYENAFYEVVFEIRNALYCSVWNSRYRSPDKTPDNVCKGKIGCCILGESAIGGGETNESLKILCCSYKIYLCVDSE